jgi:hypothetical protein
MLKCNIRGIENGYPLILEALRIEEIPSEYTKGLICFFFIFYSDQ